MDDLAFGRCSKRGAAADAMIAGDARKLGRHFAMVAQERREALLQILSSPRHLARAAAKEKRHAEIYASLPVFDPETDAS
jgi:hypothetical protein